MRFFCVILRWSVCVCRWSFLLGVRAVHSLLFRQILNSISRSECKNGPIKGSATHAMRSCACAMFRPMAHPASDDAPAGGPISNVASCRAVDRRTVLHRIRRERLGVNLLPSRGYKQRVGQAWARRTRGCLRFRSRTCRSRMQRAVQHKAHTHAPLTNAHWADVEGERAQYVLVPQDALRPAKLGRRGRLERA